MRRKKEQEQIVMPDWVVEESMEKEQEKLAQEQKQELVPVYEPIQKAVAKEYLYMQIDDQYSDQIPNETPWYERDQVNVGGNEGTWDRVILSSLANRLQVFALDHKVDLMSDKALNYWLDSQRELFRAISAGLIDETDIRVSFGGKVSPEIINKLVKLIFN